VTDQPAKNFFEFMEPFVRAWGYSFPSRRASVPKAVGMAVGTLLESASRLLRPVLDFRPVLTRSSVHILCTDISFDTDLAERDLGYRPCYDEQQAFDRTVEWFRTNGPVEP
jgi:nucleoside-diphosphate-sugar epimerase